VNYPGLESSPLPYFGKKNILKNGFGWCIEPFEVKGDKAATSNLNQNIFIDLLISLMWGMQKRLNYPAFRPRRHQQTF